MRQPVVILGGLLSSPRDYRVMADVVARLTGQRVFVVRVWPYHWLGSAMPAGWAWHLDMLERVVVRAVQDSPTGKITLIGHSLGGIIGRLFLSPRSLRGHAYNGIAYVDRMITLGSPHDSRLASRAKDWGEDTVPGAFFAPQVRYSSAGARTVRGDRHGSPAQRAAYGTYRLLCGHGDTWGDGLVPADLAMLRGAHHLCLEGVHHSGTAGRRWYGSPDVVCQWWSACDE